MQETRVRSLGWEDALEKEMATSSSILAWSIPWTVEPDGLQSQRVRPTEHAGLKYTPRWPEKRKRGMDEPPES